VDITDEAALDKVFAENPEIDNVIHFAALKVSPARPRKAMFDASLYVIGRWRIWRDSFRVLPCERIRQSLPTAIHGEA
jgi:hypothetical protein